MSDALRGALAQLLGTEVRTLQGVAGGDINRAYQATLDSGRRVFVKTHAAPPAGAYACEAEGLVWLRAPRALRVPEVLAVSEQLLVLEWIDGGARGRDFDERFGRGLAQLHRAGAPSFGMAGEGYLANLALDNRPRTSWSAFYGEQRLLPLGVRARDGGWLSAATLARLEALCTRLSAVCGAEEPPSRLHGDLWSGNVMVDAEGAPVIVDPAAYGGDREVDLAMLRLFGAPSARFFAAYAEVYPPKPGADERVALYQLLPLLVHVCLFGPSYVGQLERGLARYA
ncbi:MAG TPA: fructosamine kinase family protein [Polyangiaceae bacterium]|nr:fructosamine kinase family protein [Polyangiaceae bacterium]